MRHRHFTLIELLTVIAIIAILAGITFGGITYASNKAQHDKTVSIMLQFEDALEAYKKDYGVYPISTKDSTTGKHPAVEVDFSDSMWAKFKNNKRNRPYMEGADGDLLDAYGKPFLYQYPIDVDEGDKNTSKFALWSRGDDGYHGKTNGNGPEKAGEKGSDDICNWKSN